MVDEASYFERDAVDDAVKGCADACVGESQFSVGFRPPGLLDLRDRTLHAAPIGLARRLQVIGLAMATRRLDPYSLRLFASAAEEGSIARAAAREHLSASALSRRIAASASATAPHGPPLQLEGRVLRQRHFQRPADIVPFQAEIGEEGGANGAEMISSSVSPRAPSLSSEGRAMAGSVYKVIELVGTSTESWEKAAAAPALVRPALITTTGFDLTLGQYLARSRTTQVAAVPDTHHPHPNLADRFAEGQFLVGELPESVAEDPAVRGHLAHAVLFIRETDQLFATARDRFFSRHAANVVPVRFSRGSSNHNTM